MKKNKKCESIGGMALFDGMLLRNSSREIVVTKNNYNEIEPLSLNVTEYSANKNIIQKIPILRGVVNIFSTIKKGIPVILKSAQEIIDGILSDSTEFKVNYIETIAGIVIAILLIFGVYVSLPIIVSSLIFNDIVFENIFTAIFQIFIFYIYVLSISKLKLMSTLFKFHGAEHKLVNAYDKFNGDISKISIEEIKKSSRFHIRCGGNFLVYFIILTIIASLIISPVSIINKIFLEIILIPIFLGLAFEILMIISKLPKSLQFVGKLAMNIQRFTTLEPNIEQIKLAYFASLIINSNDNVSAKDFYLKYKLELEGYDYILLLEYVKNTKIKNAPTELETIFIDLKEQFRLHQLIYKYITDKYPLQYIIGKQFFYNEEYIVDKNVLIPRADTEILIEQAIKYINNENLYNLLDMCTGSGCIGISIAKNSNVSKVTLVDISTDALNIANKNIMLNNVQDKCSIKKSDLFKNLDLDTKYDIIVSNPPYIKTEDIKGLSEYVKKEPLLALDGGTSGLNIYLDIFNNAINYLNNEGLLIIEIGYDQKNDLINIIENNNNFELIECIQDYSKNDRVIVCRFHNK